jgi:hypothetical protein
MLCQENNQRGAFDLILSVDLSSLLLKLTFLRGGVNKKKGRKKERKNTGRKRER